ncbi:MAG: hypothetical protein ABI678_23380, partial [Kofleriaceae bacterium]
MVIEVFGFSPRVGSPDLAIVTFASELYERDPATSYVNADAYRGYLRNHPRDDYRNVFPIAGDDWIDDELVSEESTELVLRATPFALPARPEYAAVGIELVDAKRVHVYEACRYIAAVRRDEILATAAEQRVSILPGMQKLLQLEEWHHPDLVADERPSHVESFQQLAGVLAAGDTSLYRPTAPPNTHWRNWPDGGTL